MQDYMNFSTKKSSFSGNKKIGSYLVLGVVVIAAIAGIAIAQRQFFVRENVSPSDPNSQPSAAGTNKQSCTLSFTPETTDIPGGSASCISKEAHTTFYALNPNFQETNLPYRSNVYRGQQFVYRITVSPDDVNGSGPVEITDPLPSYVTYVNNSNNTPGITYDSNNNVISLTLPNITSQQMIEFMVQVNDDAPTTSPINRFWNTAYVGDDEALSPAEQRNKDAACTTKLVVQPDGTGGSTNTGGTAPSPTQTPRTR